MPSSLQSRLLLPARDMRELRTRREGNALGGEAIVEVENGGSHLDEDQLRRLFGRFYRADASRQRGTGGTGLELAIVKHLVEAHGGRVWARSGVSSVTVGFSLPASAH